MRCLSVVWFNLGPSSFFRILIEKCYFNPQDHQWPLKETLDNKISNYVTHLRPRSISHPAEKPIKPKFLKKGVQPLPINRFIIILSSSKKTSSLRIHWLVKSYRLKPLLRIRDGRLPPQPPTSAVVVAKTGLLKGRACRDVVITFGVRFRQRRVKIFRCCCPYVIVTVRVDSS